MFDPKDYDSPQVKLTLEWRQAFDKKDPELIAKSLHKDYRRTTHPRSLGKPEQTREEWLEQITGFLNALAELELSIHPVVDVPGKVTIHGTNRAKTAIGVEMNLESIFIVHIVTDEDGSLKIKHIEEFLDSKTQLDFAQLLVVATAKK